MEMRRLRRCWCIWEIDRAQLAPRCGAGEAFCAPEKPYTLMGFELDDGREPALHGPRGRGGAGLLGRWPILKIILRRCLAEELNGHLGPSRGLVSAEGVFCVEYSFAEGTY